MGWYDEDIDYIHLKWGDMRKCYNFTDEFRSKQPKFCAEYEKYFNGDQTCRFETPLQIAQYVDMFDVPVKFYYNFTDTPSKDITDVYEYLIREYGGITKELDGSYRDDYQSSLDGDKSNHKAYTVSKVK